MEVVRESVMRQVRSAKYGNTNSDDFGDWLIV